MGLFNAGTPRETAVSWAFVLVQLLLLGVIVLLPGGDAWTTPDWLDIVAQILELAGIAILLIGLVNLGRSVTALPHPVPHGELKTGGLYRLVRHPVYTGVMALAVGAALGSGSVPKALAAAALIGWFMLKARWEETRLRAAYPGYDDYATRTPRFVPLWPVSDD
jgi:protein-S-isoprenylcysteine O-methyltransferase Ste14